MSKYILFAFEDYYPSGGLNDRELVFSTYDEFYEYSMNIRYFSGNYQILEISSLKGCYIKLFFGMGLSEDRRRKEKQANRMV